MKLIVVCLSFSHSFSNIEHEMCTYWAVLGEVSSSVENNYLADMV